MHLSEIAVSVNVIASADQHDAACRASSACQSFTFGSVSACFIELNRVAGGHCRQELESHVVQYVRPISTELVLSDRLLPMPSS